MVISQAELVFSRPELVHSMFGHLQKADKQNLRLTCASTRQASMPLLTRLCLRLSCSVGLVSTQAERLRRMEHVQRLHLIMYDSHVSIPDDDRAADLLSAVLRELRWWDSKHSTLIVEAIPTFTIPLARIVQGVRTLGRTVIISPVVRTVPLLRMHPAHAQVPDPTLMLATGTLQNYPGMNWSLRKVVLTSYAPDRLTPPLGDERGLAPFAADLMPNLATLSLMFGPNVRLDLSEELEVDLSQLKKLQLMRFELMDTGLGGLMDAAPGLTRLDLVSQKVLGVPNRHPPAWPHMRRLLLAIDSGSPGDSMEYRDEDFVFPGESFDPLLVHAIPQALHFPVVHRS